MCLIDPQAHTYVQPPNSNHLSNLFATLHRTAPRDEYTIYWDGGAKKIAAWKRQHLRVSPSGKERAVDGLCSENWKFGFVLRWSWLLSKWRTSTMRGVLTHLPQQWRKQKSVTFSMLGYYLCFLKSLQCDTVYNSESCK